MEYLGFKRIEDPLFRADKTMMRLQSLVPPDKENAYIEAMEKFNEKVHFEYVILVHFNVDLM